LPRYKIHSVTIYFNSWYSFSLTVSHFLYVKTKYVQHHHFSASFYPLSVFFIQRY